jgi:hypothetical protein
VKINVYASKTGKWIKRGAAIAVCTGMGALLGSCGGSGVSSDTGVQVGALSLLPPTGTLYANTPFTFTVAGGRKPYNISTNEPTVLPVPTTLDGNTFTVIPNNPGVVDPGGDANTVPRRSVSITIRDNAGTQISSGASSYAVLQNFLTGYSIGISTIGSCGGSTTGTTSATEACVGADSQVNLRPTSAGLIQNRRPLRLSINYGSFSFVDSSTNTLLQTQTVTTDDTGQVSTRIRVLANIPTQYAGLRVTDVQSGIYRDVDFTIRNPTPTGTLSLLPSSINITGALTTQCGTGSVDVVIYGGTPPYQITSSAPDSIRISAPNVSSTTTNNPSVTTNSATFTVTAFNSSVCLGPGTVVVRDSGGNPPATFTVTTAVGTTVPTQPLAVVPASVCVQDGGSAVVVVSGGNNQKVVSSSNPNLIVVTPATGTGSFTVTLAAGAQTYATYAAAQGIPVTGSTAVTVSVFDGSSATGQTVNAIRRTTCQ